MAPFHQGRLCQGSEEARVLPASCCVCGGGLALHTRSLLETHFKSQTTLPGNQVQKAQVSSKLPCRVWGTEKACVCWLATCQSETRCAHFWDKAVGVETCLLDETGHQASPGPSPQAQPGWRQ